MQTVDRLYYSAIAGIICYLIFFYLCWVAQTDAQGGIGLFFYSPVIGGLSFFAIYLAKQSKPTFWAAIGLTFPIALFYFSLFTSIGFHDFVFKSVREIGQFIVGVPPYDWGRGNRVVHLVAREGDLSKLEEQVDQGKKVNLANSAGETPLFFCVAKNKIKACQLLVKFGANVNHQRIDSRTALHNAATYDSHLEMVRFLVKVGADTNVRDKENQTPLAWAMSRNNVAITEYLRGIGAEE